MPIILNMDPIHIRMSIHPIKSFMETCLPAVKKNLLHHQTPIHLSSGRCGPHTTTSISGDTLPALNAWRKKRWWSSIGRTCEKSGLFHDFLGRFGIIWDMYNPQTHGVISCHVCDYCQTMARPNIFFQVKSTANQLHHFDSSTTVTMSLNHPVSPFPGENRSTVVLEDGAQKPMQFKTHRLNVNNWRKSSKWAPASYNWELQPL